MNTYSALSMLAVMVIVLMRGKAWPALFRHLYAFALALLFIGTAFYHATLTHIGQWTDGVGLYAVIAFVGIYFLGLIFAWSQNRIAAIYAATLVASGVFSFFFMQYRLPLFAFMVVATFVIIILSGFGRVVYNKKDLLLTCAFFCVGMLFQITDRKLIWCSPHSPWQGHALWHLLSAVSTYFLFALMQGARKRTDIA